MSRTFVSRGEELVGEEDSRKNGVREEGHMFPKDSDRVGRMQTLIFELGRNEPQRGGGCGAGVQVRWLGASIA